MMLGLPLNDYPCLSQIVELASELLRKGDPAIDDLVRRFPNLQALVRYIRSLPQRDDTNDPSDGPRADQCAPPQRLRIPASDPNCFERAALYLVCGEKIDTRPLRQLATIDTPAGRHTFVVEDGHPIVLDPNVPKNALEAGLFQMAGARPELTPEQQVDWICAIAEEPAAWYRGGVERVRAARNAMRAALLGRPIARRRVVDIAFTLSLAEREAKLFGGQGVAVQRAVMNAMVATEIAQAAQSAPPRNGVELQLGRTHIRPDWGTLEGVAKASGRVGARVAGAVAQHALAHYGIPADLLAEVERELQKEGLTLGPLVDATAADRALVGTLAALIR